jgi:hypothetical protein
VTAQVFSEDAVSLLRDPDVAVTAIDIPIGLPNRERPRVVDRVRSLRRSRADPGARRRGSGRHPRGRAPGSRRARSRSTASSSASRRALRERLERGLFCTHTPKSGKPMPGAAPLRGGGRGPARPRRMRTGVRG